MDDRRIDPFTGITAWFVGFMVMLAAGVAFAYIGRPEPMAPVPHFKLEKRWVMESTPTSFGDMIREPQHQQRNSIDMFRESRR